MNIYLNVQNLKYDIQAKHTQELNTSELIQAGVLTQAMNEAYASLKGVCVDFLAPDNVTDAYDNLSLAETLSVYLRLSPRRGGNKGQALADKMHSYLVNATLAKVYSQKSQPELVKQHSEMAASDSVEISHLLNTKLPPRL